MVGGLLVAVAAVLVFAAYGAAGRSPRQLYVVATHDLHPGERLRAADLATVSVDIPDPGLRRQLFGSPAELLDAGASVVAPVGRGGLVEASAVVGRGGSAGTRELSLAVDRSRAVGGTLKPGEFVDVLSTFGSGSAASTQVVLPHVEVLTTSYDPSGGTSELIVFAVPDGAAADSLANAGVAGQVTLVRSADQLAAGGS